MILKDKIFSISFDKQRGTINKWIVNGNSLIQKGPVANYWRAPNDNDKGSNMIGRLGVWRETSNNLEVKKISLDAITTTSVSIIVELKLPTIESTQIITYKVQGNGRVFVTNRFTPGKKGLPDLPRFGMRMELPVEFDNLKYFGRGPHENYCDRNHSAFVGLYHDKVENQYEPYVRPQENGYKTDVRWFELRKNNGLGIRI